DVRGQDPQGRQAGRPARGAADEVRARYQHEDREGAQVDDRAVGTAQRRSGDRVMDRRAFVAGTVAFLPAPLVAEAQPARKVYRIGYLGNTPPTPATLLQGLREHGYVEGENLIVETRYSEGRVERFAEFAAEFIRLKVDVIVAPLTPAALAARAVTS